MKRQTSLYFIVIGAFLLFISGGFLTEGLSRVGMDNAVISQRMSEGFEDFWLPSLDTPGSIERQNYLPLGYWLESQWYKLFGDNTFMAEKVYSVLTYFILAALILWIWKLIGQSLRTGWLPLMCWITIPIVSWSATNNLLESTMTMFILLSVVFLLKAGRASFIAHSRLAVGKKTGPYKLSRTGWIVLAALMMELAFMVKGFAGLFPIFFPILYWLMVRRERVLFPIYTTGVILAVWMVTLFVVIFVSPDVYHHLYNYVHGQMIGGVLHVQTVASRFYILYALLLQGSIPIAIMLLLCLIRIKGRPFYRYMFHWRFSDKLSAVQIERSKLGWFFLAIGLSGILPIMLGHKQQEFYIVPSLPFFAISMACLLYDLLEDWLENMNKTAERVLMGIAIVVFGTGLILNLASIHKVNSNQELLSDMKIILPYLDYGETISVSDELNQAVEAEEYFYRYKRITFDSKYGNRHLLTMYSNIDNNDGGLAYSEMDLPTVQYRLYEKSEKTAVDTVSVQWDDCLTQDSINQLVVQDCYF